jgi:hypothetical protein
VHTTQGEAQISANADTTTLQAGIRASPESSFDLNAEVLSLSDRKSRTFTSRSSTSSNKVELKPYLADADASGNERNLETSQDIKNEYYGNYHNVKEGKRLLTLERLQIQSDLLTDSAVDRLLEVSQGRPSVDMMIRSAVTDAQGSVQAVAAVGREVMGQIALCVSHLTREIVIHEIDWQNESGRGPNSLKLWCEQNGD